MQIKRFHGEGIHKYIDLQLVFNEKITFVTGINGSGKTTALNGITSLITPNLQALATTEFSLMRVEFSHDRESHYIYATREGNLVQLYCSGCDSPLSYHKYVMEGMVPTYKERDHEHEYYRDISSRLADHPVTRFIESLPTPMFLGLNRRAKSSEDVINTRFDGRWPGTRRNLFANTLSLGARDAVALAETRYRDTLIALGRLSDRLKRDLLFELLNVDQADPFGGISVPTTENVAQIAAMRQGTDAIATILGLPRNAVRQRMLPLLDKLLSAAKKIPPGTDARAISEISTTDAEKQRLLSALIDWSARSAQVKRIKTLSDMVESYNQERGLLTKQTDDYSALVGSYLKDSKKSISFDDNGYISFIRKDDENGYDINIDSLSSGEAQIFVILTNLFFHPQAQENNVFIIDEPELSLHIQWQEMLVDSMMAANPNIQYIMATHSPSIIMDKTDYCADVLPLKRHRGGKKK